MTHFWGKILGPNFAKQIGCFSRDRVANKCIFWQNFSKNAISDRLFEKITKKNLNHPPPDLNDPPSDLNHHVPSGARTTILHLFRWVRGLVLVGSVADDSDGSAGGGGRVQVLDKNFGF